MLVDTLPKEFVALPELAGLQDGTALDTFMARGRVLPCYSPLRAARDRGSGEGSHFVIPSEGWRVQFVVDHYVFIQVVACHVRVLVVC